MNFKNSEARNRMEVITRQRNGGISQIGAKYEAISQTTQTNSISKRNNYNGMTFS